MRGLKYISWGDSTGYATAAKAYIRALMDEGVGLTWTPMLLGAQWYEIYSGTEWPCAKLGQVCNRPIEYDTVVIHTVPEYYPALVKQEREKGCRVFGYTVWELDSLPCHWPPILNQLDGVLVPCKWNLKVFRESGVTVPIHVVPHISQFGGIQRASDEARAALQKRLSLKSPREFIFYTIGHWSNRKAPYLALEAYWKAFGANDRVLMVIKTSRSDFTTVVRDWRRGFRKRHPSPTESVAKLAQEFPNAAPVIVIADESLGDDEILALHEIGDCFVSLSRSEGWGMGTFDAALMANPVVVTGFGGHLDYLRPETSFYVDHKMMPVVEPLASSYNAAEKWAEASVEHASLQMKQVYLENSAAREFAMQQAHRMAAEYSPRSVINSFIKALA